MNQGEFYIYSPDGGTKGIDTIKVVGGRFTYERFCEQEVTLLLVFPNFSEQPIFAEPGKSVDINADASHIKEMEVEGTKDNELMTTFRKQISKEAPPEVVKKAEQFINEHPESPVGVYLLRKYFILTPEPSYAKAIKLVDKMLEKQPKNGQLIIMQRQMKHLQYGVKGATMPHFSGPGIDGGTFSDKDLGDGVAVLSSWGSWNYESRELQRQLRRAARKSGGRLKLVSICVDPDKKACKRNLEADSVWWPVIFDGKMFESPAFNQSGLADVPDNIVYHHRRVVARGLSNGEIMPKIEELLDQK